LLQQEAGLALAEIAEVTGVGVETVKSRLRYAISRLRAQLGNVHMDYR
jgi:RNA polymerase sigma-70 factor (ECF subfamily)